MSALARLGISKSVTRAPKQRLSDKQRQTQQAFSFKWAKRENYESENVQSNARRWILERYCENDAGKLGEWLDGGGKIILDAGCGSGYSALLFFADHLKENDYLGVDISDAVEVARIRFEEHGYQGDFLQADIMDLPIADRSADMIVAEGVLHHTDNTQKEIRHLAKKLKKGGMFLFYVYAKKAVIREFTDDYIREQLKDMSDEEAWEALNPLTRLGIALGQLNAEINVPEDIPSLGIKSGKVNLQHFFYWNMCKLYYRPEFSFEEMHMGNFDWYRPLNCHRHTPEEVRDYCDQAGLSVEHMNVQQSGITVVARKAS